MFERRARLVGSDALVPVPDNHISSLITTNIFILPGGSQLARPQYSFSNYHGRGSLKTSGSGT